MTNLELDSVTKVFGNPETDGVIAVNDLSLDVPDGDLLVLLGPSGCGKTTTLRMIGGLEAPTDGEIRFDGTVVNDVKARNRDVAMVFQDFALYPHMTVRENLGFGLRREDNDMTEEEITTRVTEVAEMLEIETLLNNKPAQLSGGQKQRVALGRAIIREPRLFLFDEPLANLDAQLRKTMRTEIDELQSQVGITSAYVTHNQEEAMTIADEIAILNGGKLQQLGSPDEVFNEPANLFVAQFVGSPNMNLYNGILSEREDTYRIEMDITSVDIPKRLVDTEIDATEVLVGFRPQDLYQARNRDLDGPTVEADIRVVEPVGTEAVIHGETVLDDITGQSPATERSEAPQAAEQSSATARDEVPREAERSPATELSEAQQAAEQSSATERRDAPQEAGQSPAMQSGDITERSSVSSQDSPDDRAEQSSVSSQNPSASGDSEGQRPSGNRPTAGDSQASPDHITAKVGAFYDLSEGETLSLTIALEHIYLFDAQTKELLKGRLVVKRAEDSSTNRVKA